MRFDGATTYVESPSSIVTNFGPADILPICSGSYSSCRGNFSIDAWIRVDPLGSTVMTILDKRTGSPPAIKGYHLFVLLGTEDCVGLQLADGAGSGLSNYHSPGMPTLTDGNWHHIAVTVRRTEQAGIRWYHDGVLIGVSDPTDRLGSLESNSPLRIGTRTADPTLTGWFKGDLDELEIFNRVLTPEEVATIFTAGASGKCK
ncbi:MAG TPA: LamG domain-containing protein [Thermoanaerobaculia bacterium]|nr:LamG domain-containing protein [Thermoanaerobaculia bacterium]